MEVVIDHETTDYVVDNASIMYFNEADPTGGDEFLLRMFILRRGYSVPAGIPGHYLNSVTTMDPADSLIGVVELPAVVTFVDEGLPAKICLAFRKYRNTKICCKVLDMPLQLTSGEKETFVAWKTAASVKLNVIKSFIPLARSDGYNQTKMLAKWVKHSPSPCPFRNLKIDSLQAFRSWVAAGRYSKNIDYVCDDAILRIRKQAKDASGAKRAGDKSKSAATADATSAELPEVERRVKLVDLTRAHMKTLTPFYDAPVGARLIECVIPPPEQDGVVDTKALEDIIKNECSKENAMKLIAIVQKQAIVKLLSEGKGEEMPITSPFLLPPVEEVQPEASTSKDPLEEARRDLESSGNSESESDDGTAKSKSKPEPTAEPKPTDEAADSETRKGKRSRAKPTRLDMDGAATKAGKKEKKPKIGATRSYVRSGLYSKDPMRATAARMRFSGIDTPSSESDSTRFFTPGEHSPLSLTIEFV